MRIFLIFALIMIQFVVHAGTSCPSLFSNDFIFNGTVESLNDPSLQKVLKDAGFARPTFFDLQEERYIYDWRADLQPYKIQIRSPNETSGQEGLILLPETKGAVVEKSKTSSREWTQDLFTSLVGKKETGEHNTFQMSPKDALSDTMALKKFRDTLVAEANLSPKNLKYVETLLREMIHSGRAAMNDKNEKLHRILGFRMRWKMDGQGQDYDSLHEDSNAFMATTLAIIGSGTEYVYLNRTDHSIDGYIAGKNQISHILGGKSNSPVLHRASTIKGRRLVFLIFWGNQTPTIPPFPG